MRGGQPAAPTSIWYELLATTDNLARSYNTTPFDIMAQDCDEVILLINYLLRKADHKPESAPAVTGSDRDESAAFWAAL